MNEPSAAGSGVSLPARGIPWPVWALLAGAIVQLAVQIAPDSYQVFGPYFLVDGSMLIQWLQSMSPFLLAAAVVLGADRWPMGRRTLLLAAAALAVAGVLRLAMDAWWALWEIAPGPIPPETTPWLTTAWTGSGLAAALAYALLAAGLWMARPDRRASIASVALTLAIGVAGLVATGGGLWVVAQTLELRGTADGLWVGSLTSASWAASFAALAAIAIVAVRIVRSSDPVPEILIGSGAVVTMLASAWTWVYPQLAPMQAWDEGAIVWAFTMPAAVVLIGTVLMIAGFALAGLGLRRASAAHPA